MIIKALIEIVFGIIKTIFALLPNLPSLPNSISNSINNVFTIIFNNMGLIGIFVRVSTIKIMVPLVIAVLSFKHIYHFVMWIIRKIPLSIS